MSAWGSEWWASGMSYEGSPTPQRDWRCILDHYYNANSNSVTADPTGTGNPGVGTGDRIAFLQGQPTYGLIAYEAYDSKGDPPGIRGANAADGSGDYSIVSGLAFDPSWQPGGAKLAYANASGIAVMNADGSGNPVQLTSNACSNTPYNCDFAPAWSPFSNRIAFCSIRSGSTQIWIMNSDGSNPQQLTTGLNLGDSYSATAPGNETLDCRLSWSPDETEIAVTGITYYSPLPPNSRYNVYTIDAANGANLTQLTDCHINTSNEDSVCSSPQWSPDGTQILFSDDDVTWGDNYGGAGIYTINASDGAISPIFQQLSWHDWFPHYSTDGKKIFYSANPNSGSWYIFSKNSDNTGNPTQIASTNKKFQTGSFDVSKCGDFGHL